jgi:hypothetical protein
MDRHLLIGEFYGAISGPLSPGDASREYRERYDRPMDVASEAARLRAAAEARPLKLPVNRRVDERHHLITPEGLGVWFTIQLSPHSRIYEALFERGDHPPSDQEISSWLEELMPGREAVEAPGLPGALARRFEVFDRSPDGEAPLA